ncbi:MAG: hypothetical protein WBA00_17165 [Rhodococcus sp. (in: high G+C Gram-positive bacteria)]
MGKRSIEPIPAGLGEAGSALWRSTADAFELEAHELATLREVCRTADAIDALRRWWTAMGC